MSFNSNFTNSEKKELLAYYRHLIEKERDDKASDVCHTIRRVRSYLLSKSDVAAFDMCLDYIRY